jgi:glycosyltransferase involved in cell wall biosynthesis
VTVVSTPTISVVIVSKDEPALDTTLATIGSDELVEIVVVDASSGRLDWVRAKHPEVRWVAFHPPAGRRVTIAAQRNVGVAHARGEVVLFIDSGCIAAPWWCERLAGPVLDGEELVVAGRTAYEHTVHVGDPFEGLTYVPYAPTINLAVARSVFATVGGFDETFAYGSDLDLATRLHAAGIRIRYEPSALVEPDWGSARRQLRRAYRYGRAKPVLFAKYRRTLKEMIGEDPIPFAYGAAVLVAAVVRDRRLTLALGIAALVRNRRSGRPVLAVAHHLVFTAGFAREAGRVLAGGLAATARRRPVEDATPVDRAPGRPEGLRRLTSAAARHP